MIVEGHCRTTRKDLREKYHTKEHGTCTGAAVQCFSSGTLWLTSQSTTDMTHDCSQHQSSAGGFLRCTFICCAKLLLCRATKPLALRKHEGIQSFFQTQRPKLCMLNIHMAQAASGVTVQTICWVYALLTSLSKMHFNLRLSKLLLT